MCRSAVSLNSLHSIHPTAAESQCLCCASRNSTGSIDWDSMLAPHHPIAVHADVNRFGSPSDSHRPIAPLSLPASSIDVSLLRTSLAVRQGPLSEARLPVYESGRGIGGSEL